MNSRFSFRKWRRRRSAAVLVCSGLHVKFNAREQLPKHQSTPTTSMAISESQPSIPPNPPSPDPSAPSKNAQEIAEDEDEDEEEEDVEVEMEDDDDEEEEEAEASEGAEASKLKNLARRMSTERIFLRVHDIIIKGNAKTKDSLIEAQLEHLKNVTTFQDLLQAAAVANARLEKLDIFDSVSITIDQGPSELPGTANVIVKVVEAKNPVTGDVGIFSKPEVIFSCLAFWVFR
ncbi:hypothetical protein ACLOJK_023408 [Asimina triloba]